MKKIFSILLFYIFVLCAVFGITINSKEGYDDLPWGSTVKDAEFAGYKLTPLTSSSDKTYLNKLYSFPVDAYKIKTKDKDVKVLQFHYYLGKLFSVIEMLNTSDFTPQKLESRYGNFKQQGIFLVGKQYMDAEIDKQGVVTKLSIVLSSNNYNISVTMFDWEIYKNISLVGQKLTKGSKKTSSNAITDELMPLANKLIQEKNSQGKPSFAFMALTTDYKNTLVDNYVTDALTEAMFNTGKIKIIERANLESILKEQKFQSSGLVNEETVKSIGMIAGVDFVCYGNLKDLGDQITVNARVVDVETGEIAAMSRLNIKKDEYLKSQPQSAVGSKTASVNTSSKSTTTNKTTTQPKPTSSVANNAWKVSSIRNEFDGYTEFIFTLLGTHERRIAVIYQRWPDKYRSKVICGIKGGLENSDGFNNADIKCDDGSIVQIKSLSNYYYKEYGVKYRLDIENTKKSGRNWLKIIMDNKHIVFRAKDAVTHFETAGLLEKMAEYGITWKEIDAALANEEF